MSYCSAKNRLYWKDMQSVWREEIAKKCDWNKLFEYDFKENDEWKVADSDYEQAPLSQIVWGEIIAKYLKEKYKKDYDYIINRHSLVVFNVESKEESYRFLFDVMYNLKSRYVKSAKDNEKYHCIGNFAPLPGNVSLKRSLQFIHRDKNESWSEMMKYLEENWNSFKMQELTFQDYKEMILIEDEGFSMHQECVSDIKILIKSRGEKIQKQACKTLC